MLAMVQSRDEESRCVAGTQVKEGDRTEFGAKWISSLQMRMLKAYLFIIFWIIVMN